MAPVADSSPTVTSVGIRTEQTAPGVGPSGEAFPGRLPTLGGSGQTISLPMKGPSPRVIALLGVGIAVVGIATGGVIAWRARTRTTQGSTQIPETAVALVETPQLLRNTDGGAAEQTERLSGGALSITPIQGPRTTTGTNPSSRHGVGRTSVSGREEGTAPRGTDSDNNESGTTSGRQDRTNNARGTRSNGGNDTTTGGAAGNLGMTAAAGTETGTLRPRGPSIGGYVEGEETDATGRMDPRVFTFVYRHYRSQIASCHSMVSRGQEVVGTMRIRVRLGTDGRVVRTRVLSNTTQNEALANCVQNQIRTWRYPQPEGGEVEFDYNFGFGN